MSPRILFVCLGNICRSPTAEAVMRARAAKAGLAVEVDSAGTGGWHAGEAPHPPMIAAARARGYDLAPLRARQIKPADFTRFDHVFVMDRQNLRDAEACRKAGVQPELFLSLTPDCGHIDMPDPWYTGSYDLTVRLCETAADALIARLVKG